MNRPLVDRRAAELEVRRLESERVQGLVLIERRSSVHESDSGNQVLESGREQAGQDAAVDQQWIGRRDEPDQAGMEPWLEFLRDVGPQRERLRRPQDAPFR